MDAKKIADLLGDCDIFGELTRKDVEKIARLGHVESYKAGEQIFSQGDHCKDFWVITEGNVYLERAIDLGGRKGKATICILGKGRALGCWSSLLGQSHNLLSSAICQKPTTLVVINGHELRKMMIDDHELGFSIMQELCVLLVDRIKCAYGAMENI